MNKVTFDIDARFDPPLGELLGYLDRGERMEIEFHDPCDNYPMGYYRVHYHTRSSPEYLFEELREDGFIS